MYPHGRARARANPWCMYVRAWRGSPKRGHSICSYRTTYIHTLKLSKRASVRGKESEGNSGRDEKGRTWSVADYRVALTNILHLPPLSATVGKQLVERIPGRLADGPRPPVPHWQATRGPRARIGSAARAGHLQIGWWGDLL